MFYPMQWYLADDRDDAFEVRVCPAEVLKPFIRRESLNNALLSTTDLEKHFSNNIRTLIVKDIDNTTFDHRFQFTNVRRVIFYSVSNDLLNILQADIFPHLEHLSITLRTARIASLPTNLVMSKLKLS
jgi:hypothetical protein